MAIPVLVGDITHDYKTIALNCVPYPVASLVSYAKSQLSQKKEIDFKIYKYPKKIISAALTEEPAAVCFSNYMWNLDLSYGIAQRIKRKNPKTVIIFGGPNYPTDEKEQKRFLERFSAIDFYVYKEGEMAFAELMKVLLECDMDISSVKEVKLTGTHFLRKGEFFGGPPAERIQNLDLIPSPYLTGLMDEFLEPNLVPMIQNNRGCPFRCTFCVEGLDYYNKVNRRSESTIYKELQYIAEHKSPTIHDLHIVDSNFGMYKEDEGIGDAIAAIQEKFGWPEYIHVATGKNQKERVLRVAKKVKGAMRLSGAVQSLDPKVLKNIKRDNIKEQEIMQLGQEARELQTNSYSEVIAVLPEDTKESHFETNRTLLNAGFQFIRNYPLMMLWGVEVSSAETRKNFEMKTGFRIMSQCFGAYLFGDEEPIYSAEIEEICTSTKDMSFEDYLECRAFNLAVEIFYNDSILLELIAFVKPCGIKASDLIFAIFEKKNELPPKLKKIFDNFRQETTEELSENENELAVRAKTPEAINEYAKGKHGSNMIYRFKALAFMEAVDEIINFAFARALELLNGSVENLQYFEELKKYCLLKKNRFLETDLEFEGDFHFDFSDTTSCEGKKFRFFHDEAQKRMVNDNLDKYGRDSVGVARLLSKYNVTKMLRTVEKIETPPA